MGEVINFPSLDDVAIKVNRTEEFFQIARELSDYIKKLPLTPDQHNKLVELMIKQVQAAEQGAFNKGFLMGYKFSQDTTANDS